MNNLSIMFDAPLKVSLARGESAPVPSDGELLVQKLYSLISTGTELACLSGGETWFKMPAVPGYCCVSKVVQSKSAQFKEGEILFHYGSHCLYQCIADNGFIVRVPEGMELTSVPMLRMATIAFTAVRISDIELGDYVAVTGLGLVGNMAAQLAKLSGATVIGIDTSPNRRQEALDCGIDYVLPSADPAQIKKITGDQGVHTAIEATGVPQVAEQLLGAVGYHGEIIFLGTPRGGYEANLANVLRYCHIDGQGSVNFKGAHEWRFPVMHDKFVKHSIERNTLVCMDLIKRGKLHVEGLITEVVTPEQAPEVYLKLNADRNAYLGVIIDWTKG